MRKAFLSFAFRDEDRPLAAQADRLLASLNVRATTGEHLGGAALTPAVKARIEEADGLIALFTRRDSLGNGAWTTHSWVQYELNHARDKSKLTVSMVEGGVKVEGPYGENEYIPLDRDQPLPAFLALAETIGLWKERAGRVVKVQILPEELARQLGDDDGAMQCRHRFLCDGKYSDWKQVEPVIEQGGAYIYLTGVQDEAMIQLAVDGQTTKWRSVTTPQWVPITLRKPKE